MIYVYDDVYNLIRSMIYVYSMTSLRKPKLVSLTTVRPCCSGSAPPSNRLAASE